jgi:D-beta-D-heptose 7-phosphate kinase/D-beta-D-heptose 1-phosphate adenosyltransferase
MLAAGRDRIEAVFDAMRGRTVMVVGDLMLDAYIWGRVDRISPEAPVPVVEVERELFKLGGAGNVANNLLSLGARVTVAAVRGDDEHGRILADTMEGMGLSTDCVFVDRRRRTTVKTRVIAHTQQVTRIDREDRSHITDGIRKKIVSAFRDALSSTDALIVSDYGKGVVGRKLLAGIVHPARQAGIPVCVDPKERNFPHYHDVSVITPNVRELSFGAGIKIEDHGDMVRAAEKVREALGCDMVLVTRGEHGMSLFGPPGGPIDIPTNAKAVFDVTGAGDTVAACFTLAYASGATPLESAMIANVAAGMVVAEVGAASVPWERLREACLEETGG